MKKKRFFRSCVTALLVIAVVVGIGYGCFVWLFEYSFDYPIGNPKLISGGSPTWSPDGKYIAFSCGYTYPLDHLTVFPADDHNWASMIEDVCVLDMQTKQMQRLTYGRKKGAPIWSPNGDLLAWWDERKNEMVIYDFKKGNTVAKVKLNDSWSGYLFSSDGQKILSENGIAEIDIHTHKLTLLSNSLEAITILPSADGQYVAAIRYDNEIDWNQVLTITRNEQEPFRSDFSVDFLPFEWSPTKPILMFAPALDPSDERFGQIAFLHMPNGEITWFQPEKSSYVWAWSPNGDKVAYLVDNETIKIIKADFDNLTPTLFIEEEHIYHIQTPEPSKIVYFYWGPEENQFAIILRKEERSRNAYIHYGPIEIWLFNLDTAILEPLSPDNLFQTFP